MHVNILRNNDKTSAYSQSTPIRGRVDVASVAVGGKWWKLQRTVGEHSP